MKGYLLDTNIITFWFDASRDEHIPVCNQIARLPAQAPLMTSAIVIGEIEYGRLVATKDKRATLGELPEFIRVQFPRVLEVSKSTSAAYGDLRARLFKRRIHTASATERRQKTSAGVR